MTDPYWRVDDTDADVTATGEPPPALVSLHYLLGALRRRWRFWAAFGCVGMLLGAGWTVAVPAQSTGTTTLLLAHDPNTDPMQAMSTDVSLLRTRSVANAVIDKLDLQMTPEALQGELTATSVSSTILVLEIPGPSKAAAVRRARVVADKFLAFRKAQVKSQTKALVRGYEKRLRALQRQSNSLSKRYDTLAEFGTTTKNEANDVLTQRSQVDSDMNSLRQTITDTTLKNSSIIAGSYVLDPASVAPHSTMMRAVMATGSGVVGGLALSIGLVLVGALTSNRLRRRDEVALALGAPVRLTVSGLNRKRRLSRLWRRSSDTRDLEVLVQGIDTAVFHGDKAARKGRATRLAVGSVAAQAAEHLLAALAARLSERGKAVFLVDLSESGRLEAAATKVLHHDGPSSHSAAVPTVFRPDGVPSLARGPGNSGQTEITDLPETDPRRPAWNAADVVLTLAEVDPAVGVDHLRSWADQMILLVAAGGASAERLRSTADLIRAAGPRLLFAVMVGTDGSDESVGIPDTTEAGWSEARSMS